MIPGRILNNNSFFLLFFFVPRARSRRNTATCVLRIPMAALRDKAGQNIKRMPQTTRTAKMYLICGLETSYRMKLSHCVALRNLLVRDCVTTTCAQMPTRSSTYGQHGIHTHCQPKASHEHFIPETSKRNNGNSWR